MMEKKIYSVDLNRLPQAAEQILQDAGNHRVFALFGEMGAGKTTLIKTLCRALKVTDEVSSPTFALVNEYATEEGEPVFHFDFYRIKTLEEVFDIGYEEYIYSGHYCFIEWPEKIMELLPDSYVYLSMSETEDNKRTITYRIPER